MAGNILSRIGDAGGKIGEALMQIASMTESRRYRAAMLDRGTAADELALARIERDGEMMAQNIVQQNATWMGQGWTGTPGTQVWTPGQAPIDTGVEQPEFGGLFDRQPTEINPLAQAAMGGMGVEPGATYPGPSPIAMGGDPSEFGAELMQVPKLGGDFVPGSFEDASYDPRMGTAYQDRVALTADLWRQWWYSERNGPPHRRGCYGLRVTQPAYRAWREIRHRPGNRPDDRVRGV